MFEALAVPNGFAYVGQSGAGHFTKMVHNGIEYAMLEAYGEGVGLLSGAPLDIDIVSAVSAWQNGSVIRSWLLELAGQALEKDPSLENAPASVGGGETGSGRCRHPSSRKPRHRSSIRHSRRATARGR